jgi:trehalose/maltose hydrolase-like predicted phosphorylase
MSNWTLAYDSFVPEEEGLREALSSTGNGYFCTRGAAEWARANEVHYPGTYMHGGFNRATTIMAGRPVVNEDLVNLPNWLCLNLKIGGGEPFSLDTVDILSYRHELDIKTNLLTRSVRFRDRQDRETTLISRRFVSMASKHHAMIEWTLTAENWSGPVEILSALDGRVTNWGVPRYRDLEGNHLNSVTTGTVGPDGITLLVQSRQSRIYIAEAARTRVYGEHEILSVNRAVHQQDGYIHQTLAFDVEEKTPVRIEKAVAFYSSRDAAISEPLVNAASAVERIATFNDALGLHAAAWDQLWAVSDIRVPSQERVELLLRFHISHVLQTCSLHTADLDAGVPARGLNGEAYRGHIFWDELYIYPFLVFRLPDITRELLMYRYRRLGEARWAAHEAGYKGAMFPWQSGSDGTEETQVVHLNPKSGSWDPDFSHNQRHVSAAIFYNIWEYYNATGDIEFLWDFGAEMMLEIARFWGSIAHFNPDRGRYEIHGVMGPDEYHEKHHDSEDHGLRNNAYTNIMVAWICETAQNVLELLPEGRREALRAMIGLSDDEVRTWSEMSYKMYVPFHDDGIMSQFEGFDDLDELDWDGYRTKYGNIQRLDRILRAEGNEPDAYKLAKQADTLMLWFLFSEHELRRVFERLGYPYSDDALRKHVDYYHPRTSHGSTLSFIVHAGIEGELDPVSSWDMFLAALESDVGDIQGGTTAEGIHMGVMAGTLDLIQRGYMGSDIRDGTLYFNPKLTDKLDGLSFYMEFREVPMQVHLESGKLTVTAVVGGTGESVSVGVGDTVHRIKVGDSVTFDL